MGLWSNCESASAGLYLRLIQTDLAFMRNRAITRLMIFLMLLQPVTSLASACFMPGDSEQRTAQAMALSLAASHTAKTDHDMQAKRSAPSCHEEATPAPNESDTCKSCTGGVLCSTACSVMSSSVTCDYHNALAARPDVHYTIITQAIIAPSPFELYRPPRLS
ncbi:Uncharacterised protein [Halioglobus japonicus]|nr:Uncharacterised protein [Halioglobus japonicus]